MTLTFDYWQRPAPPPFPLEKQPAMIWASQDIKTINGHSLKDISDEIEKMANAERLDWKPLLDKAALYITTAAIAALAVVVIAQTSLILAGVLTSEFVAAHFLAYCAPSLIFLRIFFNMSNFFNENAIERKVRLAALEKWPNEIGIASVWVRNAGTNLNQLSELRDTARSENNLDSSEKIQSVIECAIDKYSFLHTLPERMKNLLSLRSS